MEPQLPQAKRIDKRVHETQTSLIMQTYGLNQNTADLYRSQADSSSQKTSVLIERLNKTFLAIEKRHEEEGQQKIKQEISNRAN